MHFQSEAHEFGSSLSQRSSEPRSAKSSYFQVSNSLFKGFVGIGVLTIPYGIHQTGIILGVLLMIMGAVFTFWSINLLVAMIERQRVRVASYGELGRVIGGGRMGNFIESLVIILQVGACLAYLYYVKEIVERNGCRMLGDVVCEKGKINKTILICLTLTLLLPFGCIRTITRFSHLSFIGNLLIISSLFLTILLTFHTSFSSTPISPFSTSPFSSSTASYSYRLFQISGFGDFFGVALFSIESMGVVIEIRDSMIEPKEFPKVFKQQFWTIFALYTILPVGFYLAYGEEVKEIVLFNLPNDNLITNISQILYCFGLLISFSFQIFPIYFLIDHLIDSTSPFFSSPSSFSIPPLSCPLPVLLPTSPSISLSISPSQFPPSSNPPPHLALLPPYSSIPPCYQSAPSPSASSSSSSTYKSSRFFELLSLSAKGKKIMYRMLISSILVLVSEMIPDLVWILNFLGAVGSTLLGMIIPVVLAEIYFMQGEKMRGIEQKADGKEKEDEERMEKKEKEEEEEGEEEEREEEEEKEKEKEEKIKAYDYGQGTRILNFFTMMIGVGGGVIAVANSWNYLIGKP